MNNPLTHFRSPAQSHTQRVPGYISAHHLSTMQPLCAFTFLCSLSFLSPVLSQICDNDTHYAWPVDGPVLCCNKCPPGQHMIRRPDSSCSIECEPCTGNRFTEKYNVKMSCDVCENCNKPNMEYKSRCTTIRNAVCGCKTGYRCKDKPCKKCVPIPEPTIRTTLPPSTTALKPGALTTHWQTFHPMRDTVWFLVIIALLAAGIALVVVTKIKPFLSWVKSKQGYILAKEPAPELPCCEDKEVSTPVQEVLGKCDQCDV